MWNLPRLGILFILEFYSAFMRPNSKQNLRSKRFAHKLKIKRITF